MSQVAGIILAGGRSRRMGTNKALLSVPGVSRSSFVASLASVLSPLCSALLLVARDQEQIELYRPFVPDTACFVLDQEPDHGPLMGLYSGVSVMRERYALVCAVDVPYLQPALISVLLAQAEGLDDHLLVPVVAHVPQVLLAVYPRCSLPAMAHCIRQGRHDPRVLLEHVPVRYLPEAALRQADPDLRSFLSVNTPEELARLSLH